MNKKIDIDPNASINVFKSGKNIWERVNPWFDLNRTAVVKNEMIKIKISKTKR